MMEEMGGSVWGDWSMWVMRYFGGTKVGRGGGGGGKKGKELGDVPCLLHGIMILQGIWEDPSQVWQLVCTLELMSDVYACSVSV